MCLNLQQVLELIYIKSKPKTSLKMESTTKAASDRVYQDFEPSTEWVREPLADTLMVYLPGFKKDQMKVQVTSANNLKISGTRQLNDNIWSRFRKEIPIPSNYDTNGIVAKFESGILYIRNPKLIVPVSPAPPEFSKPSLDRSTKPQNPPQEPPKSTKQQPPKPPLEALKAQETPKPTKQEPSKPSKPVQEHSKLEKPLKEEPSNPLEAPKAQNSLQETPKPAKEEHPKPEKPRTAEQQENVTNKATTSEEENAGKNEKAEALPEITESGSYRFVTENYKNSISDLIEETKNARNATNIVLAILFGVVLGLYVTNAFRSFMKSEN